METHDKLISDVLGGRTRIISFEGATFAPVKDITTGVLSALNFARLAFAIERSALVLPKVVGLLCSRKTVENALAISREWSSDVRFEVEDVYHIPLFEVSLKLVSTDYDSPSPDHITKSLEKLRGLDSSAAIILTRYPNVVTCLRLRMPMQDVFVLFNQQVSSEHKRVTSLTLSTSLPHIVQQLCGTFPLDKTHNAQGNLDWQAKLLKKCTGHVFTSRTPSDPHTGEEALILSSLTLLTLRAELKELTRNNGDLKREKRQLERSAIDLETQITKEKAQTKRSQSSKSSGVKTTSVGSLVWHARGSHLAQSPSSRVKGTVPLRIEEKGLELALQLQAAFDSENDFLMKQKHELVQTAQRQYHCGVCLDDFPEDDAVRIDACGHEICRDCARGHVLAKIEEHRFPVLCPVCMADHENKDPGTVPGALVQLLGISEDQWGTWVEMEMAEYSIPFNCRKCRLSGFADRQDLEAQSEIHCPFPTCDHVWCRKCQQTIEPGGPEHSCDGTAELDHLVKQEGWRYCPNCKTPIQKIQGCNHLSCIAPGCNTHFCYRCGKTINRTAIPHEIQQGKTAHFRACSLF